MEGRALCRAPLPHVGVLAWRCGARRAMDEESVMLVPLPTDALGQALLEVCLWGGISQASAVSPGWSPAQLGDE